MSNENIKNNWKEFDDFYSAHELQLYGMQFPKELAEKLYVKLKNEIFDTDIFFEILDNQNENRYMLKCKKDIEKNDLVFLIDHCWTYKLRQFNYFCENYPQIIKRSMSMLKYGFIRKPIITQVELNKDNQIKNPIQYNSKLAANNKYIDLNYDDMEINDDNFNLIHINETTETLSLENNKIENIQLIYNLLDKYKNLKGLWIRENPFCEINDNYEEEILNKYPNIEILNRHLTQNSSTWAINYLLRNEPYEKDDDTYNKYNEIYGTEKILDLSDRNPFIIKDFSIFKNTNITICTVDISDNEYDFSKEENKEKLINFLSNFPPKLNNFIIDALLEYEETDENLNNDPSYNLLMDTTLINKIIEKIPNIKYINNISIETILKRNKTKSNLCQLQREIFVHKYMWQINRTYRLVTSEKYDEDSIWYINDEFGSSINHSDIPNCAMFPFIFSKTNNFEKDELITYSILWPLKNLKKGDEVFIDFLTNISENEERSQRLTCWYKTPEEYFNKKFNEKIKKLNDAFNSNSLKEFEDNTQKLINMDKNNEEISNDLIKKIFDFKLCNNDENLINKTIEKIKESIKNYNNQNKKSGIYFEKNFNENNKIKVVTDLPYVKENLKIPNMTFTNDIREADIIWLNTNIFTLIDSNNLKLKNNGENIFLNQYPYESIITLKSNLTYLIQKNLGINNIMGISYDMKTELSEIIGNYYYNERNGFDNTWILKPINMSRSMDMIVTNNINEIIRSVETGPKICQKYYSQPYLMNNKKFDLRFIIAVKNLFPLELYFYDKMFWIRSSNKNYSIDPLTFDDYEIHFTVMNYSKFGMKTIYDKDFINYLNENKINWDEIYVKLQKQIKDIFILASKDCPQMINYYSRSIYGLDSVIDSNLQPHVLEINFQPDCTRACKFVPEFYNDLFYTLYLDHESGMKKIE
jgi:tubulin--tyrosine ligase-like protein 12